MGEPPGEPGGRSPHAGGHPGGGVRARRLERRAPGRGGRPVRLARRRVVHARRGRAGAARDRRARPGPGRRLRLRRRSVALELGGGTGLYSAILAQHFPTLVTLDLVGDGAAGARRPGPAGAGRRVPSARGGRLGRCARARQHVPVPGRGRAGPRSRWRGGVGELARAGSTSPPTRSTRPARTCRRGPGRPPPVPAPLPLPPTAGRARAAARGTSADLPVADGSSRPSTSVAIGSATPASSCSRPRQTGCWRPRAW